MAVLTHLETDSGTNVDISAATAVGAYTANGDKLIMVDVSIDAVAGNGDYVMYVTRQIGGSGSAYRILPQTTMAAASGLTAISGQSGWITVRNGDVLTCYVDGLAGDTSTPDWTTRWFESTALLVTLADDAITAAKFDESTAYPLKSADTGATAVARTGADSDTLETLSDQMDKIDAKTTLIDASSITVVAAVSGTTITLPRGDTLVATFTDIGALTDYVSIDFTVKEKYSDSDDDAIIRIRKNASGLSDGLLRLNKAAPTTETGSITINDTATEDITIKLDATASKDIEVKIYVYDIQMIKTGDVSTLTYGKFVVLPDVTRLVA